MVPIKEKFRYDVVGRSSAPEYEKMPEYFLADSPEEAEELYNNFSSILNKLSYNYSTTYNIEKSDLFGEALIGLGRAKRDFDEKRSSDFKSFAIRKIKDALNEYVKDNTSIVAVPSYLRAAQRNIRLLEHAHGKKAKDIIQKLKNSANRAGISVEKLIERAETIPENVSFDSFAESEIHIPDESERKINNILLVNKLKNNMSREELKITELIMQDMSYEEIGTKLGHTKGWVSKKISKMRKRLKKLV